MKIQYYFTLVIFLVSLDQTTKLLAYEYLGVTNSVDINMFFSFTLVHNEGAAFGFLAGNDGWQRYFLSGVAIIASIFIGFWMLKISLCNKLKLTSLALILSGAIGNLIDRVINGFVVDFIHFHYQNFNWPIFNFADICITFGVLLLLIADFKK